MAIRDQSFFDWRYILRKKFGSGRKSRCMDVAMDPVNSNIIYACGTSEDTGATGQRYLMYSAAGTTGMWVARSVDYGATWETVYQIESGSFVDGVGIGRAQGLGVAVDSSGTFYVCGMVNYDSSLVADSENVMVWTVWRGTESDPNNLEIVDSYIPNVASNITDMAGIFIAIGSGDSVYVAGTTDENTPGTQVNATLRRSGDGLSGTFETVDFYSGTVGPHSAQSVPYFMFHHPIKDKVYWGGFHNGIEDSYFLRSGSLSGSFVDVHSLTNPTPAAYYSSMVPYGSGCLGLMETGSANDWVVHSSTLGESGTFVAVAQGITTTSQLRGWVAADRKDEAFFLAGGSGVWKYATSETSRFDSEFEEYFSNNTDLQGLEDVTNVKILNDDHIYICGHDNTLAQSLLIRGKRMSNSGSLGPRMLATSFAYNTYDDANSGLSVLETGKLPERRKLNNVSEFPHSAGLFQMPSLVLGTRDSGKVEPGGILEINHFGSVVHVMWPKQDDVSETMVKGFGDLSAGQRIGSLDTFFQPGNFINVEPYDNLTLYCYLLKSASGTLDNVEIEVERRPLKSVGFATDQAIEYEQSGSNIVLAKMKDLRYTKEVDYGNLSVRETAYPIDLPLENTKEIRISARHVNGQEEENSNFVVWGRFIKSEEET
jgi:hypothetical protein